jgi:mRNA interferase MazF
LNPVQGHEQGGRRPVVILSHNIFNQKSGTVIAAAITSQPQRVGFPLALEIISCKLPKQSWVKTGQIRTLSTQRIGKKIGSLDSDELEQIIEGLNEIIA